MSKNDTKKVSDELRKEVKNTKQAIKSVAKTTGKSAVVVANVAGKQIKKGTKEAEKKISQAMHEHKLRKYKPLFLEDYNSDSFDRPKLVVIADEDMRKGVDVCEGAIGWTERRCVPEILFIYEEFSPNSGMRFYPRIICGGAYYRHPFEGDLYLQVKDYIKVCRGNQLTELKDIAYKLGAVNCSVEVYQDKSIFASISANKHLKSQVKAGKEQLSAGTSTTLNTELSKNMSMHILMNESFESGHKVTMPKLQWFANDQEILSLINKRIDNDNSGVLNEYSVDITTSSSTAISASLASSIDASLSFAKIESGISLQRELSKEEKKQFIYKIKF